jgi:putative ABC transport system ATP-binding protein
MTISARRAGVRRLREPFGVKSFPLFHPAAIMAAPGLPSLTSRAVFGNAPMTGNRAGSAYLWTGGASPAKPGTKLDGRRMSETMNGAMIDLGDVHLSLGTGRARVHVLRGVTMRVGPGDAVGLIGPSGSGKSSLLSVIGGLERPDSGTVRIAGEDITRLGEDRLALFRGSHIGIVFQSFHLIANMTALENVAVPLEFAGLAAPFERALEMLARVGLADRARHYPAELSGGEQQRVALARALAPRPRLLLADEPTGNLDSTTGEKITELIFELQREMATTLLLVTHDAALTARCGLVLEMADGKVRERVPSNRRSG